MIKRLHKDSMSMYSHLKKQEYVPSFSNDGTLSNMESSILRAVDPMEMIGEIHLNDESKIQKKKYHVVKK